tara:strand:+ start:1212 stop:2375 length:1164 start_codon:yes stop_codon:yes gene_type:complete
MRRISALAILHFVIDSYALMIPALWLPIKQRYDLSATEIGMILGLCTLPFGLCQPLWGMLSDRVNVGRLLAFGPVVAVLGISMVMLQQPLLPSVLFIMIGCCGVGFFHPEAGITATRLGRTGMSRTLGVFLVGGFLGQAVGPLWISYVVESETSVTTQTILAIAPGLVLIVVGVVMFGRPIERHTRDSDGQVSWLQALAGRHWPVWLLIAMNTMRFFCVYVLLYTIPPYLVAAGHGQIMIGKWQSIFNGSQAFGLLLGGMTAAVGRERIICAGSTALSLIPLLLLPIFEGTSMIICLAFIGVGMAWTTAIVIQLGQGLVSQAGRWMTGMLIGFASGISTLTGPWLVGTLVDNFSARTPLYWATGFAVAMLVTVLVLPSQKRLNALRG